MAKIDKIVGEIAGERKRQIGEEGWSREHDDAHVQGELSRAGACYTLEATMDNHLDTGGVPVTWPVTWDRKWWKPKKSRRRNLVVAAALIVAEIERLDRLSARKDSAHD